MNIADRIKYFRVAKNYSVNKLANKAGISQSYLRDIELGNKNPTVEILSYICEALDISLQIFFSDTQNNELLDDSLTKKIYQLTPKQRMALRDFLDTIINKS